MKKILQKENLFALLLGCMVAAGGWAVLQLDQFAYEEYWIWYVWNYNFHIVPNQAAINYLTKGQFQFLYNIGVTYGEIIASIFVLQGIIAAASGWITLKLAKDKLWFLAAIPSFGMWLLLLTLLYTHTYPYPFINAMKYGYIAIILCAVSGGFVAKHFNFQLAHAKHPIQKIFNIQNGKSILWSLAILYISSGLVSLVYFMFRSYFYPQIDFSSAIWKGWIWDGGYAVPGLSSAQIMNLWQLGVQRGNATGVFLLIESLLFTFSGWAVLRMAKQKFLLLSIIPGVIVALLTTLPKQFSFINFPFYVFVQTSIFSNCFSKDAVSENICAPFNLIYIPFLLFSILGGLICIYLRLRTK